MLERVQQLEQEIDAAIGGVKDAASLEQFRIAFLGSKGKLKDAMNWLKDAPREQKPAVGAAVNALKKRAEERYEAL